MAFGAPRLGPFCCYAILLLMGLGGLFWSASTGLRIASGVVAALAVLCLLLTNQWALLLPHRPTTKWAKKSEKIVPQQMNERGHHL